MLGREALAKMKHTAYLVNTSRGLILDEEALIETLRGKKLAGAALDVFTTEPLPLDHPFRTLPNVIITPHVAWYSERSEYLLHANAPRKIVDFFEGRPVKLLNPPGRAQDL
jgi:phosphoglycerate dehydrogenase-like enzyme